LEVTGSNPVISSNKRFCKSRSVFLFCFVVYRITYTVSGKGAIEAEKTSAAEGETIALKILPEEGYVLEEITAVDTDHQTPVALTAAEGGYTFIMSAGDVEVSALFAAESGSEPSAEEGGNVTGPETDAGEMMEAPGMTEGETPDIPQTGDDANPALLLALLYISFGGMAQILFRRRRRA